MKKIIFFMAILSILVANLYAQEIKMGLLDGETWTKNMSSGDEKEKLVKTTLIRGIYEGMYAADSGKALDKYYFNTDCLNLVSLLDKFYADRRNIKIPIAQALYIVVMELKKEPKDKIDEELKKLRDAFTLIPL